MRMVWKGVMPATTTCFDKSLKVDHAFVAEHGRWLIENGCTGIVTPGSLGEGATLNSAEKVELIRTYVRAVGDRAPVVAAVSSLSTEEAVTFAKQAADAGASGLMVLPAYVYLGDWRETKAHVQAIFRATSLSCMLYNNPIAYVTDFLPEQMAELAGEHRNFEAVKESSGDVRRVTAIRALLGDRLAILCGVDDVIGEGVAAGAVGWVAGLRVDSRRSGGAARIVAKSRSRCARCARRRARRGRPRSTKRVAGSRSSPSPTSSMAQSAIRSISSSASRT